MLTNTASAFPILNALRYESFCSCMMSTLQKSLTPEEWRLAAFYSLKKRAGEERLVLDPHLSELRACRPGA